MAVANPYGEALGTRRPLDALAETPGTIRQHVEAWSEADFEGTYAPGKWSFRKVLVHLAQTELALTTRARFALSQDNYAAQSFSQDDWMLIDNQAGARAALDAYTTLRQFNLAMWRALSPEQLDRPFTHPEYGTLNVGWIMAQMAGHDIHHLRQFQQGSNTKTSA
jgi:uncharacterized damage-inducible protein DinB